MGTNVSLTPELERFAREVVAEGRYNNVSEVVRDGLRLLQDAAERKKRFMRMIREVEADVEENGSVSLDDALRRMDRAIEEVAATRRTAK
jgi:antitoxin ParD1/3/4